MRLPHLVYLCALALMLLLSVGCSDDDSVVPPDSNQELSEELSAVANDSLGVQMNDMINSVFEDMDSTFRPEDVGDFATLHAMYQTALNTWPGNKDAKFGLAFTSLMMFLADDDLNTLYDEFKGILDTSFLEPYELASLPNIVPGEDISLRKFPLTASKFNMLVPNVAGIDMAVMKLAPGDPTISEIQTNLETALLPRLVEARGYLIDLIADPSYTFAITPAMQGDEYANPIVVDRSDFGVMLAAVYAAESALHTFFARNLDISSYDLNGIIIAARQNSDFLTLKNNNVGSGHMATAKARLLSAEAQTRTSITYLLAEIGTDQSNDLIKVYSGDQADLQEIDDSIAYYAGMLTETRSMEVEFEDGTYVVSINLGQFFDNPIDDPKDLLPTYSVTVDTIAGMPESYQVCYEWEANSFAEWTWPNPTLNGILPGMTSNALKGHILGDGYDWIKADCEIDDFQ